MWRLIFLLIYNCFIPKFGLTQACLLTLKILKGLSDIKHIPVPSSCSFCGPHMEKMSTFGLVTTDLNIFCVSQGSPGALFKDLLLDGTMFWTEAATQFYKWNNKSIHCSLQGNSLDGKNFEQFKSFVKSNSIFDIKFYPI